MLGICLAMLDNELDQERFARLYEANRRRVYTTAYRVLGDQGLAEDAAQEAWLSIAKNFSQISALERNKAEAYLVITSRNAAITLLRRERPAAPLPEDWALTAPDRAEELTAYHRLVELLRALPEEVRLLMEQRYLLERTEQEIAECCGMHKSTVSRKLSRGRELLRAKLREEGYDDVGAGV